MRLLYVDDDRINTLLFVEACRYAGGVEIETAATGAEALEVAGRWAPDLLVIDLHLPDTTGYQLLPALRALLQAPTLPAYLCTAEEARLVTEPARLAGFDGCWTKPVDLQVILSELARRGGGSAAATGPTPAQ
ncbi:MAG: response regulator [Leptothrix sp. (in: Bacteria)]|nr:response regulator [Leptothrix sp. (in: b-proteobacteria)]